MIWPGEKEAWETLQSLNPIDIEKRAGASFISRDYTYKLQCFSDDIFISLTDREINALSPLGGFLVKDLNEYSRLSILRYLIHAKNLPLSGKLIKPSDMPGGDFFLKGAHVLPLETISKQYENDFDGFLDAGRILGGSELEYGDISIRLFPFPRIPVVIILWAGDDEFPSKSSLLFDSSCISHAAIDILWATAMMVIEMLRIKG